MRFPRTRGATSVMVRVFIPDNSVTTGAGLAGLTSASTNLAIAYSRSLQNGGTQITGANLVTITTIGTWASPGTGKLGFKAVDATNFPGLYEIHFPDNAAAFGTGDASDSVIINVLELTTTALKIGPNMCLIPLTPLDYQDGVRLGMTALPNAAAGTNTGLPVVGTQIPNATAAAIGGLLTAPTTANVGLADLSRILGTALTETAGLLAAGFKKFFNVATPTGTVNSLPDAVPGAAGGVFIAGANAATTVNFTGNVTGNLTGSVGSVTGAVGSVTGAVGSVTAAVSITAGAVQSVWDALTANLTTANSIGKKLADWVVGTLTTGERTSIANEVEAQIIDETDSEKVLTAITDKIASVNPSLSGLTLSAIASAVSVQITTDHGSGSYLRNTEPLDASATRAAIGMNSANLDTQLDALPTAAENATAVAAAVTSDHGAGSYIRNTEPLDASGTRAAVGLAGANLDTQLDALPTNAELATALGTADDATLAAIAALPSPGTIADAVWDELIAGHAGAGSTGLALASANAPSAAAVADAVWDEPLSGHLTAGTTGAALSAIAAGAGGGGAIEWTYTVTNARTGLPLADVDVWVASDSGGLNILASGRTNQNGVATFFLDAGTVYVWRQKTGFNFTNPDTEVVS